MSPAPIVLFAYNRPDHVQKTLLYLKANRLAADSDLIVYSDAARNPQAEAGVAAVRSSLNGITGFRSVRVYESRENKGLACSIIQGVTETVNAYGRVIVLEDDMVTSPYFLTFMNEALDRYAQDDRVISVHGYVYPVQKILPQAFFLPGADCWGWATWKRGWDIFNPDGAALMRGLKQANLLRVFDFEGAYPYSKMLQEQIDGKNQSWAVRWYASALLAGKLTLYPGRSLVHNIGNDGSGSHCGTSGRHDVAVSETPIDLSGVVVEPSSKGYEAFKAFFCAQKQSLLRRVLRKARALVTG